MKRFTVLLSAAFVGLGFINANKAGAYETSREMIDICDGITTRGNLDVEFCYGYISGILDTVRLEQDIGTAPIFCMPGEGLYVSEAITIFKDYVRRYPEYMEDEFLASFYLAMEDRYPCY